MSQIYVLVCIPEDCLLLDHVLFFVSMLFCFGFYIANSIMLKENRYSVNMGWLRKKNDWLAEWMNEWEAHIQQEIHVAVKISNLGHSKPIIKTFSGNSATKFFRNKVTFMSFNRNNCFHSNMPLLISWNTRWAKFIHHLKCLLKALHCFRYLCTEVGLPVCSQKVISPRKNGIIFLLLSMTYT